MNTKSKIFLHFLFSALLFVLFFTLPLYPYTLLAQVMEGTLYQISSDSINFGGVSSSSASYKLNDTLGELATGTSDGTLYDMSAGFWTTSTSSFVTLSSPSDLTLTAIKESNESTEGVASWLVTTNSSSGYTMTIQTTTTPALKSTSNSFPDYLPNQANPDYNFTVSNSSSVFGFSPEGTDTYSRFKDNGSACNTGSGETNAKCWDGLSTSAKTIATGTVSNNPTGSTVSVRFRAATGINNTQATGSYSTSVVVTATTL